MYIRKIEVYKGWQVVTLRINIRRGCSIPQYSIPSIGALSISGIALDANHDVVPPTPSAMLETGNTTIYPAICSILDVFSSSRPAEKTILKRSIQIHRNLANPIELDGIYAKPASIFLPLTLFHSMNAAPKMETAIRAVATM